MTTPDQSDDHIRLLSQAGLSTYKIADQVQLSQSAVYRRLRRMQEEEQLTARAKLWQAAVCVSGLALLMVIAAAVASMAW